ncbi:hypothetical protein EWH12_04895 [Sphingobium cupriresistens]|uniref:Uncharacterized protein n=1 Tax=Sphingobium cupriresistens TaxID=1132417 RepID=A0A8G2DZ89_9SPHN|nr:hypothetical protein [Sphingobium sp.]RYM13600.1 hypothetical protein EWH12_04895 [Sphingobium cupriresistens]
MERAARALCALDGKTEDTAVEGGLLWHGYMAQALAVIEALHEPSAWMSEAGAELIQNISPDEPFSAHQADAANVWRIMIGAMRKDIP